MHNTVLLEEFTNLDGLLRRVAAVGVHQQGGAVTKGFAHHGDYGVGAPGPLVLVMAAFRADAEFESSVTVRVAQAREALALPDGPFDEVYQLAADMGGMGFIESNQAACMLNVLIDTQLLEAARHAQLESFFYGSTACVYPSSLQDDADVTALKEADTYPADPEDGYGWQKLFGEGLVRSVDYFGTRGEMPSHPELLDHLATRFMNGDWSQKQLIRALVLSRTYRLSSVNDATANKVDLDNRLLWRMHRRRTQNLRTIGNHLG